MKAMNEVFQNNNNEEIAFIHNAIKIMVASSKLANMLYNNKTYTIDEVRKEAILKLFRNDTHPRTTKT